MEDLERTLYGEQSTQLGKTYKVIGTIHLLNKNSTEARDYLTKAQLIFEQKGLLKLLKEVKQKLKLLQPGGKFMNDPNFNAANILSGADSDEGLDDVASP